MIVNGSKAIIIHPCFDGLYVPIQPIKKVGVGMVHYLMYKVVLDSLKFVF